MKVHTAAVRSVCFSRDSALLLTSSDDKTVKLWNVANRRFHGSLIGHTHWVYSATFCKNAELVASASEDKTVRIWDVETKASIITFQDFEVPISKVRFHPDGSCVAASGHDGCVKLWDLRSRRLLQHYDAHAGAVSCIDFHPGGDYLASTGEEEALKIWDLREGRLLYKVFGHKQPPTSCAFAPSGRTLLSGGRDNLVFIWDSIGGAGAATESANTSMVSPASTGSRRSAGQPVRSPLAKQLARATSCGPTVRSSSRQANDIASTTTSQREVSAVSHEPKSEMDSWSPSRATLLPPQLAAHQSQALMESNGIAAMSDMRETPGAEPPSGTLNGDMSFASLPQPMALTLQSMQSQMEIMARTVQLLERRLQVSEQQVSDMRRELLAQSQSAGA